jgi:hypothetical protein
VGGRERRLERFRTEQPPYSLLVRGIELDHEIWARALSYEGGIVVGRGTFTVNGGLRIPLVCTEVHAPQNGSGSS